jgi:kynureninase
MAVTQQETERRIQLQHDKYKHGHIADIPAIMEFGHHAKAVALVWLISRLLLAL